MKPENLSQLKNYIEETLTLTKDNVMNKTLELSSLYDRVLRLFVNESKILKNMEIRKEELYGTLYQHFRYEVNKSIATKYEAENFIFSDKDFVTKRLDIQNQECVVRYLEGVLDNIKNTSFQIKAYVDQLKFQQGL